jgi:hypothetical protein
MLKRSPLKRTKNKTKLLKSKAWSVFSKWIRERDNYTCFTCGKHETGRGMHAGHYVSRRHNSTLFDERNVNAQCAYCNLYLAGNIPVYALKLKDKYGDDILEELVRLSREIKQYTEKDYEEIITKYKDYGQPRETD